MLVPIESPYATFSLVNNTNLHPISHRFLVIAHYWSNRLLQGVPLVNALVLSNLCSYRQDSDIAEN